LFIPALIYAVIYFPNSPADRIKKSYLPNGWSLTPLEKIAIGDLPLNMAVSPSKNLLRLPIMVKCAIASTDRRME
jgi:hypothetical protein